MSDITKRQWLESAQIARNCAAQFVGYDNALAELFASIACACLVAGGVWR